MPTTTTAPMATFQAEDPLRLRFGFRYRERFAARW
jgi:hypothetical protein